MDREIRGEVHPAVAFAAVVALALALLLAAPARAQGQPEAAGPDAREVAAEVREAEQDDARIAAAVAARLLRQPALQAVTVEVNSGIVTLGGEVLSAEDRTRAAALAKQVDGVGEVVDAIAISSDLHARLSAALDQVQEKLVRLLAAIPLLVVAIAIVLLAWWLGRRVGRRPLRWLPARTRNPYMDGLVRRVAQTVVVIVGLVLALNLLGATALVGAVLGSAGVIGLVMGFAFKDIVENYIAGVLLSLRRPFAPDDHLAIDKYEGKVISLTSRATLLMTLDGNQVSLPNSLVFKSVVVNYTANPKRRFEFVLPVDPAQSIREAREMALAAIAKVDGVLADPAPSWAVDGYAAKGLDLRFYGWIDQRRNDLSRVRSEALRAVKTAFGAADVHGPETVRYRAASGQAPEPAPDASSDTSVNRDIDAQLAAAQRASDDDLLTPPAAP